MKKLPLKFKTPDRWAHSALSDIPALLSDHAYLERKAASNALELLNRWPAKRLAGKSADAKELEPPYLMKWVNTLAQIARDEALHLHTLSQFISRRGWKLARLHRSPYAGDLRQLVRMGQGPQEILDRLLVSGLIEARSCERFEILSRMTPDKSLAHLYKSLHASEWGHYTVFLRLAGQIVPKKEVSSRWDEVLAAEAEIIQRQPAGPGIHSGVSS